MNLDKSAVKIGTAHEIGCRLDDMLEESQKEVLRLEGSVAGLGKGLKAVTDLSTHLKKDLDEGKYDLEQVNEIQKWLDRAQQVLTNLGKHYQVLQVNQTGRTQAFEITVKTVKKFKDDEDSKQRSLLEALKTGQATQDSITGSTEMAPGAPRVPGAHPGASLKQQRLSEETEAPADAPPEEPEVEITPARGPKKKTPVRKVRKSQKG